MKNNFDASVIVQLLMAQDYKMTTVKNNESIPSETFNELKKWMTKMDLNINNIAERFKISYFDDTSNFYAFTYEDITTFTNGTVFITDKRVIGTSNHQLYPL